MRRSLGTAVFSGMLGVTLFGIFLTPVFFYVIDWLSESRCLRLAAGAARRHSRRSASLTLRSLWRRCRAASHAVRRARSRAPRTTRARARPR